MAAVAAVGNTIINYQTGTVREISSGPDGSASAPALSLTGSYTVTVAKQGFATEERNDVTLRAGETATLRVKLLVGAEKSDFTVYVAAPGVRADAQIGRPRDGR